MTKSKVFISHTNGPDDMIIVNNLVKKLRDNGITPYVAENNREPGTYLAAKIKSNIMSSDWVIGLWTKDSTRSEYVNQEIGFAEGATIPCYLFVEQGVTVKGFSEGREHIRFDPVAPSLGLAQIEEHMVNMHMKKSDHELGMLIVGVVVSVVAVVALLYLATRKKKP